ncbi:Phosphoenolpyruvate carboxylase kinase 1 [Capsicum annuum]|uniref:phosphoenolpyruvate carboxylase kinase 1 n=1 Tax=Capsicum annuum TaxID=4072 RepID=UPI0007BFD8B4|nr:phosphoenolpyruvate carboxylase kinase 1 [Capsicum annuum]KAF3685854.1 Phosphoenolpyruvate carboxylase kinase 1 [Capsicum annuum]
MFQTLKNDFQICEEIGRGKFGTVYRCESPVTGESFAVKTINKNLLEDSIDRECLIKEPKLLQIVSGHNNIVHLHKIYEDDNFLHMVMDYCPNSDLYDLVSAGSLREPQAAKILKQVASAVHYCHHMGVAHRDLKPDNILFDRNGSVKLTDFGSAEWFVGCEGSVMNGVVGTPYYVAPEVLLGKEYNEKVDVWSMGVILYIMLSGVPPFYGETPTETFQAVIRGNLRFPTKLFRSVSSEAKDLLRKMICKDVFKRYSAEQVLRHPWVINGGETRSMADLN